MNPSHSLDSLTRHDGGSKPLRRPPAWLVPLAIAAGFAMLFLALFGDRLLPAPRVEVAVVLATTGDARPVPATDKKPESDKLLFQASGWIEPDPLPIKATALVDGVVESVLVLEGQRIAKGELMARLIDTDATLSLAAARQEQRKLEAIRAAHLASITTARSKLRSASALIDSAATYRDEAADRLARVKDLPASAMPASEVVAARLRMDRENAVKQSTEADRDELESDVTRLELETQVKDHEIAAAAIIVQQAELALSRTRVVAPESGRILRLLAAPGQKKMLQEDDPESSTIAILYDPEKLQVRVDVPLADAAGLQIGQAVRIRCGLLPEKIFRGEVTRISGEADLQRNTLQAKVRILDPVEQLRPEMLCRAEFLALESSAQSPPSVSQALASWIPRNALADGFVWICDPESKRVRRRAVSASAEFRDDFVRIDSGVRPGELVVRSPAGLADGQRVHPSPTKKP